MEFSASRFVHALDSNSRRKGQLLAGLLGVVGIGLVWWIHLTRPWVFSPAVLRSGPWQMLGVGMAFMTVFSFISAVFPGRQGNFHTTGPMAGYLQQQESERKWKIAVTSAVVAAVNWLLMVVASS